MDGLNHVAFIMDGNGRWAKAKGMPRINGHKAGARAMEQIVPYAFTKGATVLSFYAFSTENWSRPKDEVNGIIKLLFWLLDKNLSYLHENQIRLLVTGDLSCLSKVRREKVLNAINATKDYKKTVNILFNYGGKSDIMHAVHGLIDSGVKRPTEADFENYLYNNLPPVDLLIRTSGEMRLSNFMLWQCAYAELYFTKTYWPDFGKEDYDKALEEFYSRNRRFGAITNPK